MAVNSADDTAKIYAGYVIKYPIGPDITCENISDAITAMQLDIDDAMRKKTEDSSSGNQRVQNRYIDAYSQRQNEFKSLQAKMNCAEIQAANESQQFFDTQYQQLQQVQGLSKSAGKSSTYLVYGMIGLLVITAGVILFKKKKQ